MVYEIHCALILATAPVILGLKLQVDGKMDFGPKWNYEYRIKPIETEIDKLRTYTAMDNSKLNHVKEPNSRPKFEDIIIKNNKSNPRVVQVAEAHIFESKNKENVRDDGRQIEKDHIPNMIKKHTKEQYIPIIFSDEHTDHPSISVAENNLTKTGKYVLHMVGIDGDVNAPAPIILKEHKETPLIVSEEKYGATVLMPSQKKKCKRHRMKDKDTVTVADVKANYENQGVRTVTKLVDSSSSEEPDVKQAKQDLYVKPRLVKDDLRVKEFTKHLYEQSIKTLEVIKDKINNYETKKEAGKLLRSYEDKFGEFVRETQNQKIQTKMGGQKVILNTLDTSNRILDRLVNYMIGNMAVKGILRNSSTENVILNELNKYKDLENKHICAKMQICPKEESYAKFSVDILNTLLSSDDTKILEIRNAWTEVLKNTDFSNILNIDTERQFLRSVGDLEKYGPGTMRAIFNLLKNIISSKNQPIKVVGKEDDRVNKTLAVLEILDNRDKKLPPNEQNVLEWNDMRNSFNEWNTGKRKDTLDLVQHFTDHSVSAINNEDAKLVERNINLILGI